MSQNGYRDELDRASARPDLIALRTTISVYYDYANLEGKDAQSFYDAKSDAIDTVMWSFNEPDEAFAYIALSAFMFNDPEFLMLVAAGPLENLMDKPQPGVIERIVAEARKSARFRWMLTGVYLHAISEEARTAITPLLAGISSEAPMPS